MNITCPHCGHDDTFDGTDASGSIFECVMCKGRLAFGVPVPYCGAELLADKRFLTVRFGARPVVLDVGTAHRLAVQILKLK